ncbi:pyridoxal 5'-phosphate synthase subunit PdxT-like [Xenia sp. Carnegie-2017]|uniref:pyridoxal 5'-phosphate synthase subunit PdxT-like n=1 Tax=Xenia sp. Carnegie-2017 TaxID=2897299 RepID=UPI001F040261|nr:pyridoxal 5'-phosphate synthase subunit PdxT-like [Xenia sp. Carnegie-2017]
MFVHVVRMEVNVGILAIQGGFSEHESALLNCLKENGGVIDGVVLRVRKVTEICDLQDLNGLIIPGGESSVNSQIMSEEMIEELANWSSNQKHFVFGTCAGLITMSKNIENAFPGQENHFSKLAKLDVTTSRNYFGRQQNSFEGKVFIKEKQISKYDENMSEICFGVFIRAPAIVSINSVDIKLLATVVVDNKEIIVAVEQNNCMGLAFHPELTNDIRWHAYFLSRIVQLCES